MAEKETNCKNCINCLDEKYCIIWYRYKDDEIEINREIIDPNGYCEEYCLMENHYEKNDNY